MLTNKSHICPGAGLSLSLIERRENKKTRKKGRHLEPKNPRVHAFRDFFYIRLSTR